MKLTIWLNCFIVLVTVASGGANGQTVTYEEAQQQARHRYPLIRQQTLLAQAEELLLANIRNGNLPQVSVNGQASYQSDVTRVTVPVAGVVVNPPENDQYRLSADVSQILFNGGQSKQRQKVQKLTTETEQQKVEVELYRLRYAVDDLYFGMLLLDEQVAQAGLVKKDLITGIDKVRAQVENGVTFRSNLDVLKAEYLKAEQRIIELQSTRRGLEHSLKLLLGSTNQTLSLVKPVAPIIGHEINRPELKLYASRQKLLEQQKKLVNATLFPRLTAFGQGGYGRPALNMLNNEFELFYIAGIRLNWNIANLYTAKNEKRLLDINKNTLTLQNEAFLLDTDILLRRQLAEIDKLKALIDTDRQIILLRESVKKAANAQLDNAAITAADYLREVNAEDHARQALIIHEVQLTQAYITYKTIAGN
ncbi:MAG TPA: TolC family protein [Sphingobacteriaceae bacterium]